MKQKIFLPRSGSIMTILLLMFVFTACTKKTNEINQDANAEEIATAKPTNPNIISVVSLKVTVNDAGNNITNDGGGDYITGFQNVSAKFDDNGNLIFSCGLGGHGNNTYMIRWLNINFSSSVVVYINPPITGNGRVTAITTVPAAGSTFIPLQNLAIGQSECVGLTGGSGSDWVMNFHRGAEDVSSSPSSYAVFTRTNSTQWTVTPTGICSSNSNICALRNGPGVLYGYYNMPFSFTLTKM